MPDTTNLVSIGHMCVALRQTPAEVRRRLAEAGVQPALTIDLAEYFPATALGRLLTEGWNPGVLKDREIRTERK